MEDRLRHALQDHAATFPHPQGTPAQHPTARWIWPYGVGIHVLFIPGQWPLVLNLTEEHQPWLKLLGNPSDRFYLTFRTPAVEGNRIFSDGLFA